MGRREALEVFRGQICIVTGAGSGIGRAMAELLAHVGSRLLLMDVNEVGLEATLQQVERSGGQAEALVGDVGDYATWQQVLGKLDQGAGRVGLLVNNAGVCPVGPLAGTDPEAIQRAVDANLLGVLYGMRALLPIMLAQEGGGRILNVASAAGLVPLPYVAVYAATKAAVVQLSESVAAELAGTEVSVTVVCAGAVRTPLVEGVWSRLGGGAAESVKGLLGLAAASPAEAAEEMLAAAAGRRKIHWVALGGLWPLVAARRLSPGLSRLLAALLGRLGRHEGKAQEE